MLYYNIRIRLIINLIISSNDSEKKREKSGFKIKGFPQFFQLSPVKIKKSRKGLVCWRTRDSLSHILQ